LNTDEKKLLSFLSSLGTIMIKNGAETQRTEQTIENVTSSTEEFSADVFAIPNCIMLTLNSKNGETLSSISRFHSRRVNFEKVIACHRLAYEYISKEKSLEECVKELEKIDKLTDFKNHVRVISNGLICMAFTILFRGSVSDSLIAFAIGIIQGFLTMKFSRHEKLPIFITNMITSAVSAFIAYTLYHFGVAEFYNSILMGSLMPLVPGLTTTYAIRDLLYGDYFSGTAKITEALITAIGIAAGIMLTILLLQNVL